MKELSDLKGLGPTRLNRMRAMGICSLRDLLYFFPVRYEDQTHETPIKDTGTGNYLVRGLLSEAPKISYFHGSSRATAIVRDESGSLPLCWFNEPWVRQQMPVGREILLYGRVKESNRRKILYNPRLVTEKGWVPVYRAVRGLPARTMREMIREALNEADRICPETLPRNLRERYGLVELKEAICQLHFPQSPDMLKNARRRIDFENMLIYLTGVRLFRNWNRPGWDIPASAEDCESFWRSMPFSPTAAQKRVLKEIAGDLGKERAMSRLVQGDVGCGKTALAFGAIFLAARKGFQSAMMAPTEILARQHFENASAQLEPLGTRCALLTGSTRAAERRRTLQALAAGEIQAIFGTHALISEGVVYHRLGLVITDEQHRFGVRQRSALQEKGAEKAGQEGKAPHVLVMSATPIPRTMALILYGDLDLSIVDELPPGRKPVQTRVVPSTKREALYTYLRKEVLAGQQAYVVCPLVEDSEEMDDVVSAEKLFAELQQRLLPEVRIGMTWGSQKSEEKARILHDFASGDLRVLVATTVIEVGVNVPSATIMIVENAERFGLSQLHQLRGRVGRGDRESWCFLCSDNSGKIRILCETGDGFEIAKKDLAIRGPGDLIGIRQSGEAALNVPGGGDVLLLDEVQKCVRELAERESLKEERLRVEQLARSVLDRRDFQIARN